MTLSSDAFATVRRLIRPDAAACDAAGDAWPGAETIAHARRLLQAVRVSGGDPVAPALAALADYLAAEGLDLGDEPRTRRARLDRLVAHTGWGGPLAEFFDLPGVANIQVNGAGHDVILEYAGGGRDVVSGFSLSAEWAAYLVARWAGLPEDAVPGGIVHGSIERMRFTYFGPAHAANGMTLQIRRPLARATLDELVDRETLTPEAASVLRAFVRARANILVSGGTNAGKSTLVNALLAEIDPAERLGVIEVFSELAVAGRPGTVAYELGAGAGDEAGLSRLLQANLYNSITRLVLGEARGGEVAQLLSALNSGVAGCIATIHAPSAEEAPRRLVQCARQSATIGNLTTAELCRVVAALNLIVVHVALEPGARGGRRRVTQMIEVYDAIDDVFKRHELFRLDGQGALRWADPDLSEATWQRLRAEQVFLPVYGRTAVSGAKRRW
jgi:pilus assembly protein CpaF